MATAPALDGLVPFNSSNPIPLPISCAVLSPMKSHLSRSVSCGIPSVPVSPALTAQLQILFLLLLLCWFTNCGVHSLKNIFIFIFFSGCQGFGNRGERRKKGSLFSHFFDVNCGSAWCSCSACSRVGRPYSLLCCFWTQTHHAQSTRAVAPRKAGLAARSLLPVV